jgi:hypothetical protein
MSATPNSSPSLADVVQRAVSAGLVDFRVGMPGEVVAYDAATQRADVAPILRETYADVDGEEHSVRLPVIRNVLVQFPGAGRFRITFPVGKGDHVWLSFSDFSLDKYLTNGGSDVDPVSLHQHNLTDAVAFVGVHPFSKPWTGAGPESMTVGVDGGPQLVLRQDGVELGGSDASAATEQLLKGNAFLSALGTYLSALETFANTAAGNIPGSSSWLPAAGLTMTGARTAYNLAAAAALSALVRTK